jgi:uncharacterized protein
MGEREVRHVMDEAVGAVQIVAATIDGAWDGHDLLAAIRHAAGMLQSRVEEVNALNVFPVPDGDTGSNMLATIRAALHEADLIPDEDRTVARVSAALSLGALMGARGNSGVILSQIFRGMGEAVAGVSLIGAVELAAAFEQGCAAAFAAVVRPVEGTILTVARDVAEAAGKVSRANGSLSGVLTAAVVEAAASVARTPMLLSVLDEAGVVDAGGKGLELLLRGALAAAQGESVPQLPLIGLDGAFPTFENEADGFGYETVFVITPHAGTHIDTAQVRQRLDQLGESVLVAGDHRAVKIHVHNTRPDEVIAYGLTLGGLSRVSVENLDRQAADVRERAVQALPDKLKQEGSDALAVEQQAQVVAVVAGDGLARVFRTLGANSVIQGGQGANPSAGELAEAIKATGAREVLLLPNNVNVRMAARQAAQLSPGVRVEVVPTRNAAEGVAAMLALDWSGNLKKTARLMTKASGRVQTLQATVAVRSARIGRTKVHHGDYIVLGPSDGLVAANSDRTVAILAAVRRLKPGFELLTIYTGQGVDHGAAEQLREAVLAEHTDIEVELVDGGQPHYDFLISAE